VTLGSLFGVIISLFVLGGSFYYAESTSSPAQGFGECSIFSTCFDCVASSDCGFCSSLGRCYPGDSSGPAKHEYCEASKWQFNSCPNASKVPGWIILCTLFLYLACFASGMGTSLLFTTFVGNMFSCEECIIRSNALDYQFRNISITNSECSYQHFNLCKLDFKSYCIVDLFKYY